MSHKKNAYQGAAMELRHLRYFVAAANELNFSRAAKKLNLSQPALSRMVRELECELGVPLFRRERFGLTLTPPGEAFLLRAQGILHECEEAIRSVKDIPTTPRKLEVGFITTALESILGDSFKRFRGNHPDVEITIRELSPGDQVAALHSGLIDVAFVGNHCKDLYKDLEIIVFKELRLEAAVTANHHLASAGEVDLKELEHEEFIGFVEEKFPGRNEVISNACAVAGFKPKMTPKASSLLEVLGMVGSGMGVSLMPSDVRTLPHPNVAFLALTNDAIEPIRLTAAWVPGNPNPALENLLEYLPNLPLNKNG